MSTSVNHFQLKEISEQEVDAIWPSLAASFSNVTLYQTPFYGEWQDVFKRKVGRYVITSDSRPCIYFQVIKYPFFGTLHYLYIPYGPLRTEEIDEKNTEALLFLKKCIKEITQKEQAVFCRLDFTPPLTARKNGEQTSTAESLPQSSQNNSAISSAKISSVLFKTPRFAYKGAYFQPRVEWALNLEQTTDELLKNMHQKTRYSINLALRKNLTVELIDENLTNYFDLFCTLSEETAQRDGFHLHPKEYYKAVFSSLEKNNNGTLVVVKYEGEVLVANLIVYYGTKAMYIYGSSSNKHRNLMPAHLAQWSAILHAKKRGAVEYNFGGIHTEAFPNKTWAGITYFKRNFGGYEIVHSVFYDVVEKPFWYIMYCVRKLFKNLW